MEEGTLIILKRLLSWQSRNYLQFFLLSMHYKIEIYLTWRSKNYLMSSQYFSNWVLSLIRKVDFVHVKPLNITFLLSYTLKNSDYISINLSIKKMLICTKEKSKKCFLRITAVGGVVPLVSLLRTTLAWFAQWVFSCPLFVHFSSGCALFWLWPDLRKHAICKYLSSLYCCM